jgi:hypothetical protein
VAFRSVDGVLEATSTESNVDTNVLIELGANLAKDHHELAALAVIDLALAKGLSTTCPDIANKYVKYADPWCREDERFDTSFNQSVELGKVKDLILEQAWPIEAGRIVIQNLLLKQPMNRAANTKYDKVMDDLLRHTLCCKDGSRSVAQKLFADPPIRNNVDVCFWGRALRPDVSEDYFRTIKQLERSGLQFQFVDFRTAQVGDSPRIRIDCGEGGLDDADFDQLERLIVHGLLIDQPVTMAIAALTLMAEQASQIGGKKIERVMEFAWKIWLASTRWADSPEKQRDTRLLFDNLFAPGRGAMRLIPEFADLIAARRESFQELGFDA